MTTETIHPCIEESATKWKNELLKWVNVPGKVHVTYIVEVRDGVPRVTLALGGLLKDEPITAPRLTDS